VPAALSGRAVSVSDRREVVKKEEHCTERGGTGVAGEVNGHSENMLNKQDEGGEQTSMFTESGKDMKDCSSLLVGGGGGTRGGRRVASSKGREGHASRSAAAAAELQGVERHSGAWDATKVGRCRLAEPLQ